jgi:galactan 5-O-arabinofuranosyltransferase
VGVDRLAGAAAGVSVVEQEWRDRLVPVLTAAGGLAGAAVALVARRRPALAADLGAGAAGVLIGAAATAALHGTRWGWSGLYADASFRTQIATRYAETPALVDFGYRDLPACHPPALGWLEGRFAVVSLTAQTTRYPDERCRTGDPDGPPYIPTLFVEPTDEPVAEVRAAWRTLRPDVPLADAVLVTSRVDLLATTPVYGFLSFKSIYSHRNGRFEDRPAFLAGVADCPTSACAAELLRDNEFDEVDGLVLQRAGEVLILPYTVDDFPNRTVRADVGFPDRVLTGPEFERIELGRIVVIALRP